MNREKAIRYGFGQALQGNISYDGAAVNIYDAITTNEVPNENLYVLLTGQTAINESTLHHYRWRCVQTIEIVSKQYSSVSKDIADDVGNQIENIILPTLKPGTGGMTEQEGWRFELQMLESVDYTEFELSTGYYEITKILQFSLLVTKLSN